jgi:hypothetical protein
MNERDYTARLTMDCGYIKEHAARNRTGPGGRQMERSRRDKRVGTITLAEYRQAEPEWESRPPAWWMANRVPSNSSNSAVPTDTADKIDVDRPVRVLRRFDRTGQGTSARRILVRVGNNRTKYEKP